MFPTRPRLKSRDVAGGQMRSLILRHFRQTPYRDEWFKPTDRKCVSAEYEQAFHILVECGFINECFEVRYLSIGESKSVVASFDIETIGAPRGCDYANRIQLIVDELRARYSSKFPPNTVVEFTRTKCRLSQRGRIWRDGFELPFPDVPDGFFDELKSSACSFTTHELMHDSRTDQHEPDYPIPVDDQNDLDGEEDVIKGPVIQIPPSFWKQNVAEDTENRQEERSTSRQAGEKARTLCGQATDRKKNSRLKHPKNALLAELINNLISGLVDAETPSEVRRTVEAINKKFQAKHALEPSKFDSLKKAARRRRSEWDPFDSADKNADT